MRLFVVVSLLLLATMCTPAAESGRVPADLHEAEPAAPALEHPPLLPAYKLPWEEKVPGKADASDDYRAAHPQWYAITQPPSGDFRPMQEWEPMQAVLLAYSDGLISSPKVAQTIIDTAKGVLPGGQVWVMVSSDKARNSFKTRLKMAGATSKEIDEKVVFFTMDLNAFWLIDYGPFPLVREAQGSVAFADFRYYHHRPQDDAVPTRLANQLGATTYRSPFDFEGGNFQADGKEFCYYSERVYYYTGMSHHDVASVMKKYYGCKDAVVLKDIPNDGTGHIDMFFKLAGEHVAIIGEYTVVQDAANEARMDDNQAILEGLVYSDGSDPITVYRLPFPHASSSGEPRTYINSTLFASADGSYKVNLWPAYSVDKDLEAEALAVWQEAMPDWQHVPVLSDDISALSGAVHCISRTVPALAFDAWVPDGECQVGQCVSAQGYDGACIPASQPDPGCWGPKWECLCNDCTQASCKVAAGCGDGTCQKGETCFTCPQDCACPGEESCNLTTQSCGLCGNGLCDQGENCQSCPSDCACGPGTACSFGVCTEHPCGGIGFEGCCDGGNVIYCQYGQLYIEECGSNPCGWADGRYECGGKNKSPEDLPFSCFQYDYPTGCGAKECGDNGAGHSCGECSEGTQCNDQGLCEGPCTPHCDDLECGDDGCGGSCGECAQGSSCGNGLCLPDCEAACDGRECGDDGCGGLCGQCGEGETCSPDGLCEEAANSQPDVVDTDSAAQADVAGPDAGNQDAGADTGSGSSGGGGSGGGCNAGPGGSHAGSGLLAVLVLVLGLVRRRFAGGEQA